VCTLDPDPSTAPRLSPAAGFAVYQGDKMKRIEPPIEVPSPCAAICRIDAASGLCEGCARTLDEISDWLILEPAERFAVWDRVSERSGVSLERSLAAKVGPGRAAQLLAWRDAQSAGGPMAGQH
jgi:predicted Fe-S protein YdhL (DUF1289 family)